jgi:hypothetical protein
MREVLNCRSVRGNTLGWEDVQLDTLEIDNKTLPEAKFTFAITGAKKNPWQTGKVDVATTVAEGEYAGTPSYFSYPEPDDGKFAWVKGVVARMFAAMDEWPTPEEAAQGADGLVAYFNRMNGKRFIAPIKHRVVDHEGADVTKAEIRIGNVTKAS